MDKPITHFMRAVLGEDATQALSKAAERSEALAGVIGPRTVIGWTALAARWDYDGDVPGLDDSHLSFQKSEQDLLTGTITLGGETLDFENATVPHLAAIMCVGMGVKQDISKSLKDSDLAGLGQNIDLLVKARVVNLLKSMREISACSDCGKKRYIVEHVCKGKKKTEEVSEVEKAELPGQQAKPGAPLPPQGFTPPQRTQPKNTQPKVKLSKTMAEQKCSVCEAPQFRKGEFTGCFCLRDLACYALAKSEPDGGYTVEFGREWSRANIRMLLDIVGGEV